MKKLTFNIFLFLCVVILVSVIFYIYIHPQEELTLEAKPIDVNQKMTDMLVNLKTEVTLTEAELDSLIKMKLNPQINEQLLIEGARFYVEEEQLYATLNIRYRDIISAELKVVYSFNLDESGFLRLDPLSIKLKDITLPQSLLSTLQFQVYDMKNSIIKITEIENKGRNIIIKWKVDLF